MDKIHLRKFLQHNTTIPHWNMRMTAALTKVRLMSKLTLGILVETIAGYLDNNGPVRERIRPNGILLLEFDGLHSV